MKDETFDQAAFQTAEQVAALVIGKQHDYGPKNILNSPGGPIMGLAVRLNDKVARLAHLAQNGKRPNNESLQDTAADIMGYGLVLSMVLNDQFTLPLEGEDELTIGNISYEQYKDR